jgi:hypothetical protein
MTPRIIRVPQICDKESPTLSNAVQRLLISVPIDKSLMVLAAVRQQRASRLARGRFDIVVSCLRYQSMAETTAAQPSSTASRSVSNAACAAIAGSMFVRLFLFMTRDEADSWAAGDSASRSAC